MSKMRILVSAGLLALGAACDIEEPVVPLGTSQQAATCNAGCGTNLAAVDGIYAQSNSPYQGTGIGCQGGVQFQCLEYAQRYWRESSHNINILAENGWNLVGQACNLCNLSSPKWVKKPPGYVPTHGDLLVQACSGSKPNGHVAVVDSVFHAGVFMASVVEQNGSCTGRASYSVWDTLCFLHPLQ